MLKAHLVTTVIGALIFGLQILPASAAAEKNVEFTDAEVRVHFEVLQRLDSENGNLYRKLVQRFGKHPTYKAFMIKAIVDPETIEVSEKGEYEKAMRESRELPVPAGGFDADEVRQHFATLRKREPDSGDLMKALERKFGRHPWYKAEELRDVEESGDKVRVQKQPALPSAEIRLAEREYREQTPVLLRGWKSPRIRKDWSDLLYTEDLSQSENAEKSIDDLVGATFSYTYDGKAKSDTWSAVGALILPWEWKSPSADRDLVPERFMLAPSVSVNRVTTNGDPANEADNLFYRIGAYAEWVGPAGWLDFIQIRGAGVYGTDTGHRASLPGFEVELEPRILWPAETFANRYLKVGFANILWPKLPEKADGSDQSLLDYQVRVWLRAEGGEIQHAAEGWDATGGSFFRIGPTVQLRVNMPRLLEGFSLTAAYSYLPNVTGLNDHESFFNASAALTLHEDAEIGHKVSLVAEYMKGGLTFTKEEVETFTIGLGIRF